MPTKKSTEIIEIPKFRTQEIQLRIVGDTPLIVHAWSAKAKREILEKQIGKPKTKARDPKDPLEDFVASMYWLDPMPEEITEQSVSDALSKSPRFGFPVCAIKNAAIDAAYSMGWIGDKKSMKGSFFIKPDVEKYYSGDLKINWNNKRIDVIPNVLCSMQLLEIHTPQPPAMREDMVRVGMGTADIRYRGEFRDWYMDLTVLVNMSGKYSVEQIVNILNAGGSFCGIGEWRPEKDGQNGMFHVEGA